MKQIILISLITLASSIAYSQIIKGTVYDSETKTTIPYAAVYFNRTLVGTASDDEGNFELNIAKYASKPLTIRAIGYQTFVLESIPKNEAINIYLSPSVFEIEEVEVETKNLAKKRKAYLKLFRREFLGTSRNRKLCEIINEEDITFNYGLDKDTVKAYARKPINIHNGALGYIITYHLDKFEYDQDRNIVSFAGDIVFNEDLATKETSDQSYSERREYAYLGSCMHFIRALWNNSLKMNGFTISRYSFDILSSGFPLSSMPNANVTYDDIVVLDNNLNKYLNKKKQLSIHYGSMYSKMYFLKSKVLMGKNGFFDPSGIRWYGDMAKQRIADMLPYEYTLGE